MQTLALIVPAGHGESPTSFASRLAARNFVSARDLSRDLGLSFQKIADGDESEIRRLACLGGTASEPLISNATRKVGSTFTLRGEKIANSMIRRARVHVCPCCIQEDIETSDLTSELAAYGRTEWLIPFFRTCAKHSVALVEVSRGQSHHEFHDFARNVAPTLPHLNRLVAEVKQRPPSPLETYLRARLEGRSNYPWLDSFPFFAAATSTEIVGAVVAFGKYVNLKILTEDQRYEAGMAGFDIMKAGPDGIDQLMLKLKRSHVPKQKMGTFDGFRATYGRLHTSLGYGLPDPAFDPMRAVMTGHILSNYPLGPGDKLFGNPVKERRFHSIRTAHKLYGMHEARLRKLVEAEGLLPDPSMTNHEVLFDACIADRLFKREDDSLSMTEVTKYLQTSRSIADSLLEAKLITRHKVGSPGMPEVFFRSELDQFLAALYQRAAIIDEPTPEMDRLVSLRRQVDVTVADAVRAVLDERLPWVGRAADARGLSSLLIKVKDLRALAKQTEILGVQVGYVGRAMNMASSTIAALVKVGALKTVAVPHPITRKMMTLVPTAEIERFKAEYITLRELSRKERRSATKLQADLSAVGVRPAFAGIGVSFFRRSDLPT